MWVDVVWRLRVEGCIGGCSVEIVDVVWRLRVDDCLS